MGRRITQHGSLLADLPGSEEGTARGRVVVPKTERPLGAGGARNPVTGGYHGEKSS